MHNSGGSDFQFLCADVCVWSMGLLYVGTALVCVCTARKVADAVRRLSGEGGGDVSVNLKQAVRSGCRVALRTMGWRCEERAC